MHGSAITAEQILHRFCTVGERHDLIVDARSADVPLDQACMAFVILDHDDGDGSVGVHDCSSRLLPVQLMGRVTVKVLPLPSSDDTDMVPPSLRTSARTCASPMPCPGLSWVPARRNRSNMR